MEEVEGIKLACSNNSLNIIPYTIVMKQLHRSLLGVYLNQYLETILLS
jgi:hypothetical protein